MLKNLNQKLFLTLLIIVYTLNFLDRQILSILAIDIQKELNIDDKTLGLMRGFSFAIFYSILGIPIAILADKYSRKKIITASLTLWSLMTAVCGLAVTPLQLFFSRMMVGVGEAGGVAPSYSLISENYPPEKRARALAIFSLGIPIGTALGIIMGAVISSIFNWRVSFYILGIIGILFAPIFYLLVKEQPNKASNQEYNFKATIKILKSKPSFWFLSIGAAFASMIGYGLFNWLPAFFVRSYETELPIFMSFLPDWMTPNPSPKLYAGYYYGSIVFIGGILGIYLGGILTERLGTNKANYARIPAIAFIICFPCFLLACFSQSLLNSFILFLIPTMLSLAWFGPVLGAIQNIMPSNMRALGGAIFLLINNLFGLGLGDFLVGLMSDNLKIIYGKESLRYSIIYGSSLYILAAIFLLIGARYLHKDWHKEKETI